MNEAIPSAPVLTDQSFLMGGIQVEPMRLRISRGQRVVRVEPKVMGVLVMLAQHASLVVSREALLHALWPEVVVNEEVLTRTISKLRRALKQLGEQALIETVPKQGYRLQAVVQVLAVPEPTVVPLKAHTRLQRHRVMYVVGISIMLVGLLPFWRGLWPAESTRIQPLVPVPITSDARPELHPARSPDGRSVAFIAQDNPGGTWTLYTQKSDGNGPRAITEGKHSALRPVWSPDGRYLAFLQQTDTTCTIMQIEHATRATELLGTCNLRMSPDLAWSPDGASLAITDQAVAGAPSSIFLVDKATGARRQITFPEATTSGDHGARFSHDGAHIAFMRALLPHSEDLHVVRLADGEVRRLTHDYGVTLGHTWHSDDQHVIVSSNRTGPFQLWQIALADETPIWLPISAGFTLRNPTMHTDGTLLFSSWEYTVDLTVADLSISLGDTEPFFASSFYDDSPAFSPGGDRVAFLSWRSGSMQVWVAERDGSELHVLTDLQGSWPGPPRWSPDGQLLVFSLREEGRTDLVKLDITDRSMEDMTQTPFNELLPVWTADGRSVIYASNASGRWQLWQQEGRHGLAEQLTTEGGHYPVALPGQNHILFEQPGKAALQRLDPETGNQETVHNDLRPFQHNWASTAGAIWFIAQRGRLFELSRFDLENQSIASVGWLEAAPMPGSLDVSYDGRSMLYAQIQKSESDLMQVQLMP